MKHTYLLHTRVYLLCLFVFFIVSHTSKGQINIAPGQNIIQNFSIPPLDTALLPAGWRVDRINTVRVLGSWQNAVRNTERIGGNSMPSNAGHGIYNFGAGAAASAPDRAIGFLSSTSGTRSGNLYVQLNNTGTRPITSLSLSYLVEKYRRGTNAAGFRIQLFYSRDGFNWTTAGPDFMTYFAPDDVRTGYAQAPGETRNINNKFLVLGASEAIGPGQTLYLAWNYSVNAGTTVSNAQAIGIDDISITAIGEAPNTIEAPIVNNTPFTLTDCEDTESVSISIGTTGTFDANNVFTVQLSDATGSFSNPLNIGSGQIGSVQNQVNITIPSRMPPGIGYRMRVFSSSPYALSDPSEPFTIHAPATCNSLASDFFRSRSTGNWHTTTTWESSADNVNWIPATLIPTVAANTVTIRTEHVVTIAADLEIDQLVIQQGAQLIRSAGAFTLADGPGNDMVVNGLFAFQGGEETSYAASSSVLVGPEATVEVRSNTVPASTLAPSHYATSTNFLYQTGAVFSWNVPGGSTLTVSNLTFFPNTLGNSQANTPVFSVRSSLTIGGASPLVVNGLTRVEAGATLTLQEAPNKTFRNGIIGAGTLTQVASSGPVIINGTTAQLGGAGAIALSTSGMRIASGSTVGLISGKVINTGVLLVENNGTLTANNFSLTGTGALALAEGATLQTSHTNGVTGSIQLSGSNTYNPSANYIFNSQVSQNTGFPGSVSSARTLNIANLGTATTTLNKSIQVNGVAIVSGAFNAQGFSFTGPGGFTLGQNATLITSHPDGVAGSIQVAGEKTFFSTASYTFTGPDNQNTGFLDQVTNVSRFVADKTAGVLTLNRSLIVGIAASVAANFNMQSFSFAGPGEFSLQQNSTLQTAHPEGITGNIQVSGLTFFAPSSNYVFNGTVVQNTGFPADVIAANQLVINNTGGGVILNSPVIIDGLLSLQNGTLTSSTQNMLTLSSTATTANASAASYVNGPLTKNGGTAFEFPVGKNGVWAPIAISAPGGDATIFRAEYFNTAPPAREQISGTLANVSGEEYWRLERIASVAPQGNVTVTLHWKNGQRSGITSLTDLRVAYLNEGANNPQWQNKGNGGTTGNVNTGSITSQQSLTSFGLLTFGSDSEGNNPLPVTYLSFMGTYKQGNIELAWSTATEIDNQGFEVERSSDGLSFEKIAFVEGHGNSVSQKNYAYIDRNRLQDAYYRLKQIDYDGAFEYSEVVFVRTAPALANDFSVYPNPVASRVVLESTYSADVVLDLRLVGIDGKEVGTANGTVHILNEYLNTTLPSLKAGVYLLHLHSPMGPKVLRMIKR